MIVSSDNRQRKTVADFKPGGQAKTEGQIDNGGIAAMVPAQLPLNESNTEFLLSEIRNENDEDKACNTMQWWIGSPGSMPCLLAEPTDEQRRRYEESELCRFLDERFRICVEDVLKEMGGSE